MRVIRLFLLGCAVMALEVALCVLLVGGRPGGSGSLFYFMLLFFYIPAFVVYSIAVPGILSREAPARPAARIWQGGGIFALTFSALYLGFMGGRPVDAAVVVVLSALLGAAVTYASIRAR